MTEKEWLECDRPHWMLKYLRPWKLRRRKMFLYVSVSCRRGGIWDRLREPGLALLDVAVRYVDGDAGRDEYKAAMQAVSKMARREELLGDEHGPPVFRTLLEFLRLKHLPGWEGAEPPATTFDYLGDEARRNREAMRGQGMDVISEEQAVQVQEEHDTFMKDQVNFLREIFGNPFRQFVIDPTWLVWNDNTVVKLAENIYQDQAFDRLPVLADALEKAGCDDPGILAHCRGTGPHVRGCWVLDIILGKG